MGKLFNKINKGFSRLFRILLFILSAFLIIYFFPKSGKFKYSFENGRPWQSENLYAPFDFAIKKSSDEINSEIEDVKLNTPLFFEIDTTSATNSKNRITKRFRDTGKILNQLRDDVISLLSHREKDGVKDGVDITLIRI